MQGLVWRLKALDPEASEGLKVIAYFDALIDGHASAHVLLTGAAVLSGCPAGYVADGNTLRVDASGTKTAPGAPDAWPGHDFGDGGRVWIERAGPAFANDEMILERAAIALGISFDRTSPVALPAGPSRRSSTVPRRWTGGWMPPPCSILIVTRPTAWWLSPRPRSCRDPARSSTQGWGRCGRRCAGPPMPGLSPAPGWAWL